MYPSPIGTLAHRSPHQGTRPVTIPPTGQRRDALSQESKNPATWRDSQNTGAEDGIRTRDLLLGKERAGFAPSPQYLRRNLPVGRPSNIARKRPLGVAAMVVSL